MKTTAKILELLKLRGPLTAITLSQELDLTSMAVRQHLIALSEKGEISFEDRKAKRGRPTRFWTITELGQTHFEDTHDQLSVQLIEGVVEVFGESGLQQLLNLREEQNYKLYNAQLAPLKTLKSKVDKIAEIRTKEGYMASVYEDEKGLWFYENHCPICSAAKSSPALCHSELNLFKKLLFELADVSREQHILNDEFRCSYKIQEK